MLVSSNTISMTVTGSQLSFAYYLVEMGKLNKIYIYIFLMIAIILYIFKEHI